jgi:hypothetical protein
MKIGERIGARGLIMVEHYYNEALATPPCNGRLSARGGGVIATPSRLRGYLNDSGQCARRTPNRKGTISTATL